VKRSVVLHHFRGLRNENRPAESFVRRRSPIASSFTKSYAKIFARFAKIPYGFIGVLSPWAWRRSENSERLQSGCWRMAPCWRSPRRSARIPRTVPFVSFCTPPVSAPPVPAKGKSADSGRLQRTSIASAAARLRHRQCAVPEVVAVLLGCSKSSRQCNLSYLPTYLLTGPSHYMRAHME